MSKQKQQHQTTGNSKININVFTQQILKKKSQILRVSQGVDFSLQQEHPSLHQEPFE